MKRLMTLAAICSALALAGCSQSEASSPATETTETSAPDKNKPSDQQFVSYELHVDGMMCVNCAATVTKILKAQDGVTDVNVNHETGKVTVKVKSGTKFDEAKARDQLDVDAFKLTSCKEVPAS